MKARGHALIASGLLMALAGAAAPGDLKWELSIPGTGDYVACPMLDTNGVLYVASTMGGMTAINAATGELLWAGRGGEMYSGATLGPDGLIYQGSYSGTYSAINANGEGVWDFYVGICVHASAAVAPDNSLIFSGYRIYSSNPTTQGTNWLFYGNPFFGQRHGFDSSPAVSADGTVYGGAYDQFMYAVDKHGKLRWKYKTGGGVSSSPAIGWNGLIYFGSHDSNVYALDAASGEKVWNSATSKEVHGSAVIGMDGTVFISSYSFNGETGHTNWIAGASSGSSALAADGTLYMDAGRLIAVDSATGATKWEYPDGRAPPTIGPDGTIYSAEFGKVFALHGTSPLAPSAWPKFHQNLGNTGHGSLVGWPQVTRHPKDRWAPLNGSTTFGFYCPVARPLSIQWRYNAEDLPAETNEVLTISPVRFSDAGWYSVVLSNSFGVEESNAAELQVGYSLTVVTNGPAAIQRDIYEEVYASNTTVSLTVYPKESRAFLGWTGDVTSSSTSVVITLRTNMRVVASTEFLPHEMKWKFGEAYWAFRSPAVGPNGLLYLVHQSLTVYAFDPVIQQALWGYDTDGSIPSDPVVGSDGTVYVDTFSGLLHALDGATGALKWKFNSGTGTSSQSGPALSVDGSIYFGSGRKVYALDAATGNKKWEFTTPASIFGGPAIASDGTVIIGSGSGDVYALNGRTGALKWRFGAPEPVRASPALGGDGTVYIGAGQYLYALNGTDGLERWQFGIGGYGFGVPAIGPDGTVYVSSQGFSLNESAVYALDGQTGEVLWQTPMPNTPPSRGLAVALNGTVYVTDNTTIYALNGATGLTEWFREISQQAVGNPVLTADGTLYLGGESSIFSFQAAGRLAESSWPMSRAQPDHRGRVHAAPIFSSALSVSAGPPARLTLHTEIGERVRVESSSNLQEWFLLQSFTNRSNSISIVDDRPISSGARFYRALTE